MAGNPFPSRFGPGRSWGYLDRPIDLELDEEASQIIAEAESYLKILEGQLVDID